MHPHIITDNAVETLRDWKASVVSWHIRTLDASDSDAFVAFLAHWVSDRSVKKHYQWLYRDNPHGQALTWLAVLDSANRIVGCTSVFPRRVRLLGSSILGGFGGDTFVDPGFRRRGIARALHETSAREMSTLGIRVHYGFPVPANFKAFIKSGALHPGDFLDVRIPLHGRHVAKKLGTGPLLPVASTLLELAFSRYLKHKLARVSSGTAELQHLEGFDSRFDDLFEAAASQTGLCCVRDSSYLEWRFVRHPFLKRTILAWQNGAVLLGYAVVGWHGDRCHVIDFFVQNNKTEALTFIATLVRFAKDQKMQVLTFRLNPKGPYAELFRNVGFRDGRGSYPLMVLTAPGDPDIAKFARLENWYLTPGDRDVG